MQNTYSAGDCAPSEKLDYEEKLIPEEIGKEKSYADARKNTKKDKLSGSDDLFLILILLLLMRDGEEDSIFIFILLALLFAK